MSKLCAHVCFISLEYIPRNGTARSYAKSIFNLLRNCQRFSTVAVPFYIPTSEGQGVWFLHSLSNICYFPLCKIIAILAGKKWHSWLSFAFLCYFMRLRIFKNTHSHLYTFFGEVSLAKCPIPILKTRFIILLLTCILGIKLLSDA